MNGEETISFLATMIGMLSSFMALGLLGLLWWLRREANHSVILEVLFLMVLAVCVRQVATLVIDAGMLGGAGSWQRAVTRHILTALFSASSLWALVRMLRWLKDHEAV